MGKMTKEVGRNSVFRSKVSKSLDIQNKPQFKASLKKQELPTTRVLRKRAEPKPVGNLTAFSVTWAPHSSAGQNVVRFSLVVQATFSAPVPHDDIEFAQYTRDRCSIANGTIPLQEIRFTTTQFSKDDYDTQHDEGDVASTGIFVITDNPGYDATYQIDATTDIHYTFGAWWLIRLRGTVVLDTRHVPLFGTVVGAHPRTFTPGAAVTMDYDLTHDLWPNFAPLVQQFPGLGNYPVPQAVDP